MKSTLFSKLKTAATGVSNRVYATRAPQGVTSPYIVYQQISGEDLNTHNGYADLMRSRWQVSVYATTAGVAETVAQQVIVGLRDWVSSPVQSCFRDGAVDGYEDDVSLYYIHLDFLVWHTDETDGEGE